MKALLVSLYVAAAYSTASILLKLGSLKTASTCVYVPSKNLTGTNRFIGNSAQNSQTLVLIQIFIFLYTNKTANKLYGFILRKKSVDVNSPIACRFCHILHTHTKKKRLTILYYC